jgi:hypothetical protein
MFTKKEELQTSLPSSTFYFQEPLVMYNSYPKKTYTDQIPNYTTYVTILLNTK